MTVHHIRTPLGAIVTIAPLSTLIPGVADGSQMLRLGMANPDDVRTAEVILDPKNLKALHTILGRLIEERT